MDLDRGEMRLPSDAPPRREQWTLPRAPIAASRDSIVVYTAITRGYDTLKEQPPSATEGADFVAFIDRPARSRTWRTQDIHGDFRDPARNAKIHKILSHVYFPDAQYSLWIDGGVTIQFSYAIPELIERHLADCDLAVFRHKSRTCIYQEAGVCLGRRLDDPTVIWRQICRYTQEGYPPNAGLAECTVLLRRHSAGVKAFNEAWWDEIRRGSKRDQLSFPYVARKVGLRYGTFPGVIPANPLFRRDHHTVPPAPLLSLAINRARRHGSSLSATAQAAVLSLRTALRRRLRPLVPWRAPASAARSRASAGASLAGTPVDRRRRPPAPIAGGSGNGAHACPAALLAADARTHQTPASLPARTRGRRSLAFGPVRDVPSWSWIGLDTARELSRHHDVAIFHSWAAPPNCDLLFVVKERPPERFVSEVQRQHTKLVYCPLDMYRSAGQLAHDAGLLSACAMVLVHSERLLALVRPHCGNTHFVEHHTRYALPTMADYKDGGFILWIGGCQYLPYLVHWLERHPIEDEVRILTDIENYRARDAARVFAAEIGMKFEIAAHTRSVAGRRLYPWSERLQGEMMRECKAALDIKMTETFEQYHKPPTKAQQYIASGIPFAANSDSYSAEYFRVRGFEVAAPTETDRWFSREYWQETQVHGRELRRSTSTEAVTSRYEELIESL
jgi:TOD1/MUCI70, glycosyltransferase-like domain